MLWYCSKLEYVARSCAKAWLERQDAREEANFREMCEAFTSETKDFCESLHKVFVISLAHLHATLVDLNQSLGKQLLCKDTSETDKEDIKESNETRQDPQPPTQP